MPSNFKKPPLLLGLLRYRCPNCHKGKVFYNKSVFPLNKCLKLNDQCEVCGQKMLFESNNGGGINYALTVMLFMLNICWYWPIFGMSYKDNSIYYYLITSVTVVILVQPWLMRLSRVIYLYIFLAVNKSARAH
jgi:uncharacterized protein (DUF983 family)